MKTLQVEFETLEAKPGVLDIAIRFDGHTGSFEYVIEENGIPIPIPAHVLAGVLSIILTHVSNKLAQR